MSGGSDFDPEATRLARIDVPVLVEEEKLDTVLAEAEPVLPENVTRVALNLSTVQDVVRPAPTLRTEVAPTRAVVEETIVEDPATAAVSEEEPTIILPSLLGDAVVITPVDFSDDSPVTPLGAEIRAVSGNSVNVRGGPGTNYSVVNRLVRGDEVEVLQDPGNGWVKLRPVTGGPIGWMADFLLSEG
mmetsp:Transcript_28995/g.55613  ORF Transcript_28995/g.55613 Transcript_28995/m.55613 type:complete len:187 (+) Transcript_28995:148-708(+)